MKYFVLTIWLFFSIAKVAPCLAADMMQNAAGDTIQIIEAQSPEAASDESSRWQSRVQEVLMSALSLTGIKYKYGGSTPETGFDCSGFVRYVFSQAANLALPPTARAISQIGKTVRKEELQPGDLVFFNTLKSTFSHVGIYIGDNKFIHAPRSGGEVRVESLNADYWQRRYNGAQRLETEVEKAPPVAKTSF